MKKTLQKKLDKLGDRLKKKHPAYGELFEIVEYKLLKEKERKEIDKYLMERHSENPYDIHQKGLKFDALKKEHEALKQRNNELLRILKELLKKSEKRNVELVEALTISQRWLSRVNDNMPASDLKDTLSFGIAHNEKILKNNEND